MDHKGRNMRISVTDAKGQLTDLVRQAEGGEEVILTRHGRETGGASRGGEKQSLDPAERRRVAGRDRVAASAKPMPGPNAARSQDFLYDEDGLPK